MAPECNPIEWPVEARQWQAASHASILTGLGPRQRGMGLTNGKRALGDEPRLAEAFRNGVYATAAFVSNPVLRAETGLARGFDMYDDELAAAKLHRPNNFERSPRTRCAGRWAHTQCSRAASRRGGIRNRIRPSCRRADPECPVG